MFAETGYRPGPAIGEVGEGDRATHGALGRSAGAFGDLDEAVVGQELRVLDDLSRGLGGGSPDALGLEPRGPQVGEGGQPVRVGHSTRARRAFFSTLPVALSGSSSTSATARGTL